MQACFANGPCDHDSLETTALSDGISGAPAFSLHVFLT